ncbi:hypothetical protein AMAG_03777 [Allomyces macrogynus ATCC 38327]|uniref:Uncharacterized protein n=1 Tax=Allomyces macrogynus (strain ATCC 38327) TaxID=578462 RepID=A0A0L0SAT2_ALLM3|nr:hypothetical protein AMAG_03777 [Allomyces macrogynus ATCC 38327]|eukprot:KNE59504.1 hypothetical protein AMAG_03777 [Allomyces macrogynus ATCC 38327]
MASPPERAPAPNAARDDVAAPALDPWAALVAADPPLTLTSPAWTAHVAHVHASCSKPTIKKFRDATYWTDTAAGIEYCFDAVPGGAPNAHVLAAIHISNPPHAVLGLVPGRATGRDVVAMLGEPSRKGGGGRMDIFVVYEPVLSGKVASAVLPNPVASKLGLQVDFDARVWDSGDVVPVVKTIVLYTLR